MREKHETTRDHWGFFNFHPNALRIGKYPASGIALPWTPWFMMTMLVNIINHHTNNTTHHKIYQKSTKHGLITWTIDIEIHSLAFFPLCFFPFGYIFLFALRRNNKIMLPTLHTSATSHQVLHNIWERFWYSKSLERATCLKKKHPPKKRRNPNLMKVVTTAVCINLPMLMLMFQAANKLCHLHSIPFKLQVASTTRFTWIPHVYIYMWI